MKFDEFIKKARLLCKSYGYKIRFSKVRTFDAVHFKHKKLIKVSKFIDKNNPLLIHIICHEMSHMILTYRKKLKKLHSLSKCRPYWKIGTREAAIKLLRDERKVDKYAKVIYEQLTGVKDKYSCYKQNSDAVYIKMILNHWKSFD